MSKPEKWVYYFGEGTAQQKDLLGGKGANLSEMTRIGLNIPTGFTITTRACIGYQKTKQWPAGLEQEVRENVARLEKKSGKKFGDVNNPLLVSVRSGAAVSLPGMMDTVLNLGLNEEIVRALARITKNERFAMDSYRRFIQMFGDVVMSIKREKFEHVLDHVKEEKHVKNDVDLNAEDLKKVVKGYFKVYQEAIGKPFPTDPREQLRLAINAVFDSWNNPRAITYRNIERLSHDMGTAVNVQEMVFGNMGNDSATGVAFTRNPSTGENKRYGEYLANAQGEDVVAGIRTPHPIIDMQKEFPEVAKQLWDVFALLEKHFKDMQDIEFTIERQKLFILQTRNAKRTAAASVKVAVDMVGEGLIDKKTALLRVDPGKVETLLHKTLDPKAKAEAKVMTKGLPASPGAAVGQIVFTAEEAVKQKEAGKKVVLVRLETSPEDIQGMAAAQGILTARGGMTSHAAVVARGLNICCVSGCQSITVNEKEKTMVVVDGGNRKMLREGAWISLDGSEGEVFEGKLPVVDPKLGGEFGKLLSWADDFRVLDVYANADTPHDAKVARGFGARGIGLCRTEHMFFAADRILAVREMIVADTLEQRKQALDKLLVFQRADFVGILGAMDALPVVIRLLDPPLHEFLPREEHDMKLLAETSHQTIQAIQHKVESMKEFNPMLGFRGCRLGIVFPEINEMQVQAIFEASLKLISEGKDPRPKIELPLIGKFEEFMILKRLIQRVAKDSGAQGKVKYEIGTMIEVPRAALTADELAKESEFMSFGTNDLTQMTCGFSRDDAGSFLKEYVKQGIFKRDPFQSIDETGVGKLMQLCVSLARGVNTHIDIGICGEHGGDPTSIDFCHRIRMNNVSCSPYRVPIARLAAAQAAIRHGTKAPAPIFLNAKL